MHLHDHPAPVACLHRGGALCQLHARRAIAAPVAIGGEPAGARTGAPARCAAVRARPAAAADRPGRRVPALGQSRARRPGPGGGQPARRPRCAPARASPGGRPSAGADPGARGGGRLQARPPGHSRRTRRLPGRAGRAACRGRRGRRRHRLDRRRSAVSRTCASTCCFATASTSPRPPAWPRCAPTAASAACRGAGCRARR